MLVSNMEVYESWQVPIIDAEKYLMDTCKEYYIDYTTCECKERPVTEGLVSGFVNLVKTIFQKAIAFLVKIWKAIVGFLKGLFKKAVEFFKRLLGIKSNKDITLNIPVIDKPGSMKIVKVKKGQEIARQYKDAISNFNREIQQTSQQQVQLMKRQEQTTISKINEQYLPLFEDVEHNARMDQSMIHRDDMGKVSSSYNKQMDRVNTECINQILEPYNSVPGIDMYKQALKEQLKYISFQGDNYFEHENQKNICLFNVKLAKRALDSKNLLKMYEMLKADSLARYKEKFKEISSQPGFIELAKIQNNVKDAQIMMDVIERMIKEDGIEEKEIFRFISGNFFPNFEDSKSEQERESKIRKWISVRIKWNENIINTLQRMVQQNSEMLGLSSNEAMAIIQQLEKGETTGVKKVLYENRDKIISRDHKIVDGRKFGLGVICISDDVANDSLKSDSKDVSHKGMYLDIENIHKYDLAISYLTNYDLTVMSHGESEAVPGVWAMERTILPNGGYTDNCKEQELKGCVYVNDYIHACIKLGFKRINLVACNGGSADLDEDIRNNHNVLIRHSKSLTMA